MARGRPFNIARYLSLLLTAALVAVLFGGFVVPNADAAQSGATVAAVAPSYTYSFQTVDGAAVRYKAYWGSTPEVSCTGGVTLAGGQVIIVVAVDIGRKTFEIWAYPPGTDSVWLINYPNIRVEASPPSGWGDKGTFDPTKACALFHQNNDGTYRLKVMFSSYIGDGRGWNLALMDTGINLVVAQTP